MARGFCTFKFFSLLAIATTCFTPAVRGLAAMPTQVEMATEDSVDLPASSSVHVDNVTGNGAFEVSSNSSSSIHIQSNSSGEADIRERFFGWLPIRTHVQAVPTARVAIGGEAVGIRLDSKGPVVVGYRHLPNGSSPAADAKVEIGDIILSVNHHPVHCADDLLRYMENGTNSIRLTVERGHKVRQLTVASTSEATHQLGLYVRDKTVGIGTLTFYNPNNQTFGALGHVITDADTGQMIEGNGTLYPAFITGLKPGKIGEPGEKRGSFSMRGPTSGSIGINTNYGVFGKMSIASFQSLHPNDQQLVPIALPSEVHTGEAKMYTVLHGQKVESFDVRIESVARQSEPSTKSMIVRVTDPRLLTESGGIVQGMSGSPLVQDGRLVGAVTHVFVSDPTRGYAVYALWMLKQTTAHDTTNAWIPFTKAWRQNRAV